MARHNRHGTGTDQRDRDYRVSYQPDWLRQVKVTRNLESGRQSTKTLFRNPENGEDRPGSRVRTRITSAKQQLDFEITLHDPKQVVKRVIVETEVVGETEQDATVSFTIDSFDSSDV